METKESYNWKNYLDYERDSETDFKKLPIGTKKGLQNLDIMVIIGRVLSILSPKI